MTSLLVGIPFVMLLIFASFSYFYAKKHKQELTVFDLCAVFGMYGATFLAYIIPVIAVDIMGSSWPLHVVIVFYFTVFVFLFFSFLITFFFRLKKPLTRTIWYVVCWVLAIQIVALLALFS